MELANFKHAVNMVLEKAKVELVRTHQMHPFSQIIFEDGRLEDVPKIPGVLLDSPRGKELLFKVLAIYCRSEGAPGLVVVTDSWTIQPPPERMNDKSFRTELHEIARDKGVVAAAAAGYGRLVETIMCQGQTKDYIYGLAQPYERWSDNGIVTPEQVAAFGSLESMPPHQIRLSGQPTVIESGPGRVARGRMFSLYEGQDDS